FRFLQTEFRPRTQDGDRLGKMLEGGGRDRFAMAELQLHERGGPVEVAEGKPASVGGIGGEIEAAEPFGPLVVTADGLEELVSFAEARKGVSAVDPRRRKAPL